MRFQPEHARKRGFWKKMLAERARNLLLGEKRIGLNRNYLQIMKSIVKSASIFLLALWAGGSVGLAQTNTPPGTNSRLSRRSEFQGFPAGSPPWMSRPKRSLSKGRPTFKSKSLLRPESGKTGNRPPSMLGSGPAGEWRQAPGSRRENGCRDGDCGSAKTTPGANPAQPAPSRLPLRHQPPRRRRIRRRNNKAQGRKMETRILGRVLI